MSFYQKFFGKTKLVTVLFVLIVLLVGFLIFFRLDRHDMLGDDGHYAFRSLGYFDYMESTAQTTPVQWFGYRPWWSYFSFHDHPAIFFITQNFFFKVFDASVLVSRLPSALAAVGSLIVLFFLARRTLDGPKAALVTMVALAVNNYFIWTGRIGLKESLFVFWLLLGLLFFEKAENKPKQYMLSGLFFGLAMLTKYTFLFILPALLIYVIWRKRFILRTSYFWIGVVIGLLVCLPIFIYNIGMYTTRGHFDIQFANMLGQDMSDWSNINQYVDGRGFAFSSFVRLLAGGYGWPYFAVFIFSLFFTTFLIIKRKLPDKIYLPWLTLVFFFLFYSWIGPTERWLGDLSPFVALISGYFVYSVIESIKGRVKVLSPVVLVLLVVSLFSLVYTFNTNNAIKGPQNKYLYSNLRVENLGYNQLDQEVSSFLSGWSSPRVISDLVDQSWYKDLHPSAIDWSTASEGEKGPFGTLLVFDQNTDWFPMIWIVNRWRFYNKLLIASSLEFEQMAEANVLPLLDQAGIKDIYFIKLAERVATPGGYNKETVDYIMSLAEENQIPFKTIFDNQGREAFYIYH